MNKATELKLFYIAERNKRFKKYLEKYPEVKEEIQKASDKEVQVLISAFVTANIDAISEANGDEVEQSLVRFNLMMIEASARLTVEEVRAMLK
jgi:hypothetical protein